MNFMRDVSTKIAHLSIRVRVVEPRNAGVDLPIKHMVISVMEQWLRTDLLL